MGFPNVLSTFPAQSYGAARSYGEFYIVGNGASAPTVADVKGSALVANITRSSAGVLVVTLIKAFPDVVYSSSDMDDTVNDGAYATIGSWTNLGTATPAQFTLNIRSGINPSGTATLVAGTVTVAQAVPAGSTIQATRNTPGGTLGNLSVPSASRTVSQFVINSSSGSETSTVDWTVVQPQFVDAAVGRVIRVCLAFRESSWGTMK